VCSARLVVATSGFSVPQEKTEKIIHDITIKRSILWTCLIGLIQKYTYFATMLTPELYRYIILKKEPVIFFLAQSAPPREMYEEIEKIGKTFLSEFKNATYRSVYGVQADSIFYRTADDNIKREVITSSRFWVRDKDLSKCQKVMYAEDFGVEFVEELFAKIDYNKTMPNWPEYYEQRYKDYYDERHDRSIDLDGLSLAEMMSVFGSELHDVKPADLIILYMFDILPSDFRWMKEVSKRQIPTLVIFPENYGVKPILSFHIP
jgi:hypothetical protein